MRYIKLGMKLGLAAYAAVSTYAFLKTLDKMIDKKLAKAMEEAKDAEKKEQAAEDFEDFLR